MQVKDKENIICVNSTNVVMNYSEIESKVREATNDDPWGPSGHLMGEIAKYVKHTVTMCIVLCAITIHSYHLILL